MIPLAALWLPIVVSSVLYILIINTFAAYVGGRSLGPTFDCSAVFQILGSTAPAGYGFATWQQSVWYYRSSTSSARSTVDGMVYALVTAGTFGWLWPLG